MHPPYVKWNSKNILFVEIFASNAYLSLYLELQYAKLRLNLVIILEIIENILVFIFTNS